jgi:hypothetical protein
VNRRKSSVQSRSHRERVCVLDLRGCQTRLGRAAAEPSGCGCDSVVTPTSGLLQTFSPSMTPFAFRRRQQMTPERGPGVRRMSSVRDNSGLRGTRLNWRLTASTSSATPPPVGFATSRSTNEEPNYSCASALAQMPSSIISAPHSGPCAAIRSEAGSMAGWLCISSTRYRATVKGSRAASLPKKTTA